MSLTDSLPRRRCSGFSLSRESLYPLWGTVRPRPGKAVDLGRIDDEKLNRLLVEKGLSPRRPS